MSKVTIEIKCNPNVTGYCGRTNLFALHTRTNVFINSFKCQWNGLSMEEQKCLRFHLKCLQCVSKINESLMGLEWHEGDGAFQSSWKDHTVLTIW